MESSGEEEEASSTSIASDSNGETLSSYVTTASEESSSAETSSILSDSYQSSDEELFVSTFTRANFVATYLHQNFSLPDPIMEYIAKNPSSVELYQKLIQTCKYFFLKNSILVLRKLKFVYKADGWYAKFNGKRILLNDISSKFWVTGKISVSQNAYRDSPDQNILSSVTQKIFRCDNKMISVTNQNISINDLLLLASKCECINLHSTTVFEDDGSVVPCEKVLSSFSLVNDFAYVSFDKENIPQILTSKTVEELIKIPHFATLKTLELTAPHNFDFARFDEFNNIQLQLWDPENF